MFYENELLINFLAKKSFELEEENKILRDEIKKLKGAEKCDSGTMERD